jgi:uncharacterized membrane protein
MAVLREVRGGGDHFVPRVAVTTTFVLVLLSVGLFIRYVTHIANMIRLLVAVNEAAVVRHACAADCQLVLLVHVGDYLPEGAPLLRLHGPGDLDDDRLAQLVSFDIERTLEQDLAFAFRQLVDIAQRALSPAVNDPTTAVQAIDIEHDLLRRLAMRPPQSGRRTDGEGTVRLLIRVLDFGAYLDLAIGQIWRYGARDAQVPERMRSLLDDLADVARPEHRHAIDRWARIVSDTSADEVAGASIGHL